MMVAYTRRLNIVTNIYSKKKTAIKKAPAGTGALKLIKT